MGRAEDALAAAKVEIAEIEAEADRNTLALHFYSLPHRLRNDSPEHANTLTDSEYTAVQALAAGKSIPKKLLARGDSGGVVLKDGIMATAQAVARVI